MYEDDNKYKSLEKEVTATPLSPELLNVWKVSSFIIRNCKFNEIII